MMRISSLMQNGMFDFENRKKALQRKEAGEAYKRTTEFAKASRNPMLAALENLIAAKPEEETKTPISLQNLPTPQDKMHANTLQAKEREVKIHEQAHKALGPHVTGDINYTYTEGPNNQRYINGGEVAIQTPTSNVQLDEETRKVLEQVRRAALAPAQPSAQDFRVAASASAQLRGIEAAVANEEALDIPERFTADVERDETAATVFGQNLESLMRERVFNRAKIQYAEQAQMVKNGYQLTGQPTFSRIA